MKQVNEILKDKIVNCQTEEESVELFEYLIQNGYIWESGSPLSCVDTKWRTYKWDTCYNINVEYKAIVFADISFYKKRRCNIIRFQHFKVLMMKQHGNQKD